MRPCLARQVREEIFAGKSRRSPAGFSTSITVYDANKINNENESRCCLCKAQLRRQKITILTWSGSMDLVRNVRIVVS